MILIVPLSLSTLQRSFLILKIEINRNYSAYFLQDFKKANNPVSFFIYTRVEKSDYTVEDSSLENIKTNEQLVIKTNRDDVRKWHLLISRYPLNAAKSWIEANEKEISEWKWNTGKLNRQIIMDGELMTINMDCELRITI
jgi:hypothetical protein